jgi:DNA-binding beta-propeller fold protein YncE
MLKPKIVFIFIIIALILATGLPFASSNYFELPYELDGPFSIDPISGALAVPFPSEGLLIIYSPVTFQEQYRLDFESTAFSSAYSLDSSLLFCGILDYSLEDPNQPGKIAVINNSTHELLEYIQVNLNPQDFRFTSDNQYLYLLDGMIQHEQSPIIKINLSTFQIEANNTSGTYSMSFALSHDETKIYVVDGELQSTRYGNSDEGFYDAPPDHSKIWILGADDLNVLGSIEVDCDATDIIQVPDNQMVISHFSPSSSSFRNSSLTVIDSTTDTVDREISFPDVGFLMLQYDNCRDLLLGSIHQKVGDEGIMSSDVGVVDLSTDTITFVHISDEEVEYILLSPDYSRIYAQNGKSNKIYYYDF